MQRQSSLRAIGLLLALTAICGTVVRSQNREASEVRRSRYLASPAQVVAVRAAHLFEPKSGHDVEQPARS